MDDLQLNNGVYIPHIGFGTYPLKGEVLSEAVYYAYLCGYRLFDTADNYYNEEDLGQALEKLYDRTSAKRDELFLSTKISDELYTPGTLGGGTNKGKYFWKSSPVMQNAGAVKKIVQEKVNNSLKCLRTDYVDLLLMHWPYPDYLEEIWYEMEQIYKEGKVRAIGVCNCFVRHLTKLIESCSVMPMVNQIECSPINTKENIVSYCKERNIRIMIYSPLMNLKLNTSDSYKLLLSKLSKKYNKSDAQIVLRFDIQRGLIPIPKSSHKSRIENNIDISDFNLTEEEMQNLMFCNANVKYMPESRYCPGL